jgi:superfamily II RNA helicase
MVMTATSEPAPPVAAAPGPPPLLAALPPTGDAGDVLSRFMSFVADAGLTLYPAQEEALLELMAGRHVVLNTPTGSGKSLVATALHFKAMAEGKVSYYTCPIKALVSEKFFALCQLFGPQSVGMLTGDASINRDAPIICCTAEVLANMALRGGATRGAGTRADYVVMDEFHYYADRERGAAWQVPLLCLADTTFLLMSATLGDVRGIEQGLREVTGREVAVVRGRERPVPLDFDYRETPLHETIEELIASRRYPIYLVNFTQRACADEAQNLMSVDICTKEEKEALRLALRDVSFDTPYGKDFQRFLRHGVGLHHAGLLPKYRLLVEKLAQQGLLKIVSGTDTLGVGVNIPIRTVLFTQLCKYDGEKVGILGVREFQQIAGRAGRKGFDERGSVVAQAPGHVVENRRLAAKQAAGKKVVMHKPPTKGYVHWDKGTFERLVNGTPEPLESRFEVTHGMLLNCLQSGRVGGEAGTAASGPGARRGGGYRHLVDLVGRSHGSERQKREQRRRAASCFRALRQAGIVALVTTEAVRGRVVEVNGELQRDFSLNQTLSLYLLEALGALDREAPTYALDVLSLVEAILENPDTVLRKQLDRIKDQRMAEMKAAGVEYEQRIEELEKLEWPKPNRDFIYATFDAFAAHHPWVGAGETNIRPKSVAREMYEGFASFDDYVRDYGLQRSEGVLLRYLSEVWKNLEQTVPPAARTDELLDLLAHFRAMLRDVDSSLLDEWESLKEPGARDLGGAARRAPRPVDLASDRRALGARLRTDLHRLVRALAARDHAAAARLLVSDGTAEPWTAERLAEAMAPYWAEHARLLTTPEARRPSHTRIDDLGDRRFRVQQRLIDPEGNGDWALDCLVDLREPRPESAPLLDLQRIGI